MDANINKTLKNFIGDNEKNTELEEALKIRKEYINDNKSLIERVDKIFVTEDGRQLLREQY